MFGTIFILFKIFFININIIGTDDLAISGIVVNGEELTTPCKRVGDNGKDGPNPETTNDAKYRFFDLGNNARSTLPNPASSTVHGVSQNPSCPASMYFNLSLLLFLPN